MKRIVSVVVATVLVAGLGFVGWGCQAGREAGPAGGPSDLPEPPTASAQAAPAKPAPRDVAWFCRRMVDVEWLAHHEPGVRCRQFSSYDRSSRIDEKGNKIDWEANGDAGNYLRITPEEGNVMAEMAGPGCITEFWSANPGGTIRIWLDGEKTPSIEMPMAELLSDKGKAPFKEPFCYQVRPVENNHTASNCYFPIPYAKSCKVAVVGAKMYYNIDYITYPKDTPIVTLKLPLTPEQQRAVDEAAAMIERGTLVLPSTLKTMFNHIDLLPGKETVVANPVEDGGGILRQVHFKGEGADKYALRKAVLKIYWDGCKEPGVVAPLVDLFGTGWMATPYTSLMSRIQEDGQMRSFWPMPFRKSARVTVTNYGNKKLSPQMYLYVSRPREGCRCKPMYFHAMYRRENPSGVFDYPFVQDLVGPGRYVGNLLNIDNPKPGWWGEGDEKVWADDDTFPSWYGTGSEDYFNDAWGMHKHARPFEGCPLLEGPSHSNKTSMYRWHVLDSIPFEKRFSMTIENYTKRCDYSSVAYWYDMKPGGATFFKPPTLADLLPCNFRPSGTVEVETLAFPTGQKRTMEQLSKIGLADEASGTGAVELALPPSTGKPVPVPLGQLKPGVYRVHLYLLANKEMPGLAVVEPDKHAGVKFTPAKLPRNVAAGSSSQVAGMVFVTGNKPLSVRLGLRMAGNKPATVHLDAVRLETAPRRGIEAESVKWTSPDHLVSFKTDVGNTALSGWGQVKMETLSVGGLAAMPVKLKPGSYEVNGQLGCGPDFGQLRIRMALANGYFNTYDGYAAKPGLRTHGFGRFEVAKGKTLERLEFMICGKHPKSKDTHMAVDYLEIRPCKGLTGYEGEDMRVIQIEHGAHSPQRLGNAFSHETQKFITFGNDKGRIKLGFELPKAGTYEVIMAFCKSHDYATIEATIDGKRIGPRLDTYSPTIVHTGPIKFGQLDLKASPHELEFRVVGKNAKSSGYYMGFDYLELQPAK